MRGGGTSEKVEVQSINLMFEKSIVLRIFGKNLNFLSNYVISAYFFGFVLQ